MSVKTQERDNAIESLRKMLKPGDVLYTKVEHASRSGMTNAINVHLIRDNRPLRLSFLVAKATGLGWNKKHQAVRTQDCGTDPGLHIVCELGRVLFPDGFKIDGTGRNGDTSGWDNDGRHALKQRWL